MAMIMLVAVPPLAATGTCSALLGPPHCRPQTHRTEWCGDAVMSAGNPTACPSMGRMLCYRLAVKPGVVIKI